MLRRLTPLLSLTLSSLIGGAGTDAWAGSDGAWRLLRSHGFHLQDVWGSSPRDVFAVGENGTILHFDGTRLSEMRSGTTATLFGVWGASATSVFAVGTGGTVLHYDGTAWSPLDSGVRERLYAAWGTSGTDVLVVGFNGTVLHYDGRRFRVIAGEPDAGDSGEGGPWLLDVGGSRETGIFAVGSHGTLLRIDGRRVTAADSGTTQDLSGICQVGKDTYVVGDGIVLRREGSGWRRIETAEPEVSLAGISGDAGVLLAVGEWSVLRHDGRRFVTEPTGLDRRLFNAVWSSGGHSFVVGMLGAAIYKGPSEVATVPASTRESLYAVWGDADGTWLAGSNGTVFRAPVGSLDPRSLAPVRSSTEAILRGIWRSSGEEQRTFVVGDAGTILTSEGDGGLTPMPSGTQAHLKGVWGRGPSDVWAVGDAGTILHHDGMAWRREESGSVAGLRAVTGSSRGPLAVGERGTVLSRESGRWQAVDAGATGPLSAAWCAPGGEVFVVGDMGTILRRTGTSWQSMASGTGHPLYAVWGTSGRDVYAVGREGTVLHFDGATWKGLPRAPAQMMGIGRAGDVVVAVGAWGMIQTIGRVAP